MRRHSGATTYRVFLSSPGDVQAERAALIDAVQELRDDPLIKRSFRLELVAWDVPGIGPPLIATVTPQSFINATRPEPRDCDLVVVIFAERMGTPLPATEGRKPDGSCFLSGTEWEYLNAIQGYQQVGKPIVLVYRRFPLPPIAETAADRNDQLTQRSRVDAFFSQFRNPDGSLKGGFTTYKTVDEFISRIRVDLKTIFADITPSQYVSGWSRWKWSAAAILILLACIIAIILVITNRYPAPSEFYYPPPEEVPDPTESIATNLKAVEKSNR